MILSDKMILAAREAGDIHIDPFDVKCLGSHSYDVHLGEDLLTYQDPGTFRERLAAPVLDCAKPNKTWPMSIPPYGLVLWPNVLYLAVTKEYTRTLRYVPYLDGKSSIGRLGIDIHCTAGRGDAGFANHWTMEIKVVQPVRVYAGMPIGQLTYHETGEILVDYSEKASAKYNERCAYPQPSKMWKNFPQDSE